MSYLFSGFRFFYYFFKYLSISVNVTVLISVNLIYIVFGFFYYITFVGKCKHATFLVCSSVAKQQTMTDHIIKGVRSSSLGMAEGGE